MTVLLTPEQIAEALSKPIGAAAMTGTNDAGHDPRDGSMTAIESIRCALAMADADYATSIDLEDAEALLKAHDDAQAELAETRARLAEVSLELGETVLVLESTGHNAARIASERDAVLAKLAAQNAETLRVLTSLANSADGLSFRKTEIVALVGVTNWRILQDHIDAGRALRDKIASASNATGGGE